MAAKSVQVGSRVFVLQKDALQFFKGMLGRYKVGDRVLTDDEVDLRALITLHIDSVQKIGAGVDHFEVLEDGYGGRCFWIVRIDGTLEKFSYISCVTGR
ncbi:DCL family protein [Xanthomonas sp. A1809]|nr:DCL family protein [Xanthomonas sp. A1809]